MENNVIEQVFGKDVFNDEVMQAKLPKDVYKSWKKTLESGADLDIEIANVVAHAMKEWALEHGATTMMTAGESTPDNVKAFVEDCGYTSVWDIFSSELQLRFGLPEFPILYTASGVARLRAGYSFTEASALAQVARCEKPMLFIHGTADDFIPYEMMDTLYNAKPGDNKAELTAEGAGHGEAMYALGDSYWDTVFDFIAPYMT